jgi:hypothetical protein
MKLYWIGPYEQKYNNGFFYNLADDGPRRPWPLYQDLACPKCMKMPEDAAIARGVDPSFKVRLSGDIACTHDGVYLFSLRAQEFFQAQEFVGIEFVSIPNERRYVFAFPKVFANLQRPDEMLRHDRRCPSCQRWRWVGFGPERMSFDPLPDAKTVFQPSTWLESGFARTTTLICGEEVKSILVAAKRAKLLQKFFVNELSPAPGKATIVNPPGSES